VTSDAISAFFGHGLTRVLRVLLLADVIIFIVTAMMDFYVDPQILPDDLKKYALNSALDSEDDVVIWSVLLAVLGALYAVLIIGLWFLQRWARVLFILLLTCALGLGLYFGEPEVHSNYSNVVSMISWMIEGAILLLIWIVMKEEFASGSPRRVTE
jgi:hypothetical protein